MLKTASGTERIRSFLVLAATIGTIAFNWLAAVGRVNGVTPEVISDMYTTAITPAGYAFAIWSLIYTGLIAFSIYQLLPANVERFKNVRSLYIMSCALNCAWIFFWHSNQIVICLAIITALCLTLFFINYQLRQPDTVAENWLAKAPFGIYFGWVTAATLVNFAVMLVYLKLQMSETSNTFLAVGLILFAAALGVYMRARYQNYFYPLAIAWALTAIGVKQSGHTLVVVATAVGTIACLIASLSVVVSLPSTDSRSQVRNGN